MSLKDIKISDLELNATMDDEELMGIYGGVTAPQQIACEGSGITHTMVWCLDKKNIEKKI